MEFPWGRPGGLLDQRYWLFLVTRASRTLIANSTLASLKNDYFWVFYGALSNVEYTLRVTDTQTGKTKTYFNPLRHFGSVGDTQAL